MPNFHLEHTYYTFLKLKNTTVSMYLNKQKFMTIGYALISIMYIYARIAVYAVNMAGPFQHIEQQIAMANGFTITQLNENQYIQTRCCYGPDSCNPMSHNFCFYICFWNCVCPCLPTEPHYSGHSTSFSF